MERLTELHCKKSDGYYAKCSEHCNDICDCNCEKWGEVVDRLGAYEDTGLEPEEVEQIKRAAVYMMFEDVAHFVRYTLSNFDELQKYKALGDYNRLRELKQADDEGRCVVPPCKVGQKVKVDVRTWGNVWNYKTVENGKFLIGEIVAITKTKKQTLVKIRVEHNVSWKRPTRRYPASAIGKTVFLTREEAALRREQDEKGGGSE